MPFAFLMGVDWADCNTVGRFLGIKTFLNEFVAYLEMAPYIKNRNEMNGGPTISVRSVAILPTHYHKLLKKFTSEKLLLNQMISRS